MMRVMDKRKLVTFQKIVWGYYAKHKRDLPWRGKRVSPYKILVSEIMLQQTQVGRVVGKYREFIKRFPSVSALACAPLRDVIRTWQGLGYNRRALYLHKAAQIIVREHLGRVPPDPNFLEQLPGIGHYTARAIVTFAFNEPHTFIETNIRSVYLHHFFPHKNKVTDSELLPLIEASMDTKYPAQWCAALMDYGSYIKTQTANPSRKSAHHSKQKKFKGSEREVRGALLRALTQERAHTLRTLSATLTFSPTRILKNLHALKNEGLVVQQRNAYTLPT